MVRLYGALLTLVAVAIGCASQESMNQPVAAIQVVTPLSLDDAAEALDCDLCQRGEAGENLWCDECSVGFIGGERFAGEACFSCKSDGNHFCRECDEGCGEQETTVAKDCAHKGKREAPSPGDES